MVVFDVHADRLIGILLGSDATPVPTNSASPSSPAQAGSALPSGFPDWALVLVVVVLMVVILAALLVYGWPSKTNKRRAKNSVVRAWIAMTLIAGLLILTLVTLGGNDDGLQKILVGAVVAAAGSGAAYYFATSAGQAANDAVLQAGGGNAAGSSPTSLQLNKIANPAQIIGAKKGLTITFYFKVTNIGSDTLTGVKISDTLAPPPTQNYAWPDARKPGELSAGAVATATSQYTIDDVDISAGGVTCVASATATRSSGATVQSDPESTTTKLQ